MTVKELDKFNKLVQIVYLRNNGNTLVGIAGALGMKRTTVSMALKRARSDGRVLEAARLKRKFKEDGDWVWT